MQTCGALFGRQYKTADLFVPKQWLVEVDMAPAADHDVDRVERALTDMLPKCLKLLVECRTHKAGGPCMPGRVPKGVFSEHDRVGIGAQQSHDKRILFISPANLCAS